MGDYQINNYAGLILAPSAGMGFKFSHLELLASYIFQYEIKNEVMGSKIALGVKYRF